MSLSALLTTVAEYVGQVLVDDCDRPAPDRVLRYFGTDGLPSSCCTENGVLSVAWEPSSRGRSDEPCPPPPSYLLAIYYDVCWKLPDASAVAGIEIVDDDWDATAAMLADVADCVARGLNRLKCDNPPVGTKAQAVLAELRGGPGAAQSSWSYAGVTPKILGSCARLVWRVYCDPRSAAVSPS